MHMKLWDLDCDAEFWRTSSGSEVQQNFEGKPKPSFPMLSWVGGTGVHPHHLKDLVCGLQVSSYFFPQRLDVNGGGGGCPCHSSLVSIFVNPL